MATKQGTLATFSSHPKIKHFDGGGCLFKAISKTRWSDSFILIIVGMPHYNSHIGPPSPNLMFECTQLRRHAHQTWVACLDSQFFSDSDLLGPAPLKQLAHLIVRRQPSAEAKKPAPKAEARERERQVCRRSARCPRGRCRSERTDGEDKICVLDGEMET